MILRGLLIKGMADGEWGSTAWGGQGHSNRHLPQHLRMFEGQGLRTQEK